MSRLEPITVRDFSQGRITPRSVNSFLAPANSVKECLNVNFDDIIGSAVVRPGTTLVGDPVATGFAPLGLAAFYPQGGAILGSELVTNGTFTGSATGWTLGAGWSYGTNNALWTGYGSELVTNGTFTGGTTSWSLSGGASYGTNNVLFSTAISSLQQTPVSPPTNGVTYQASFSYATITDGILMFFMSLNGIGTRTNVVRGASTLSGTGTYTATITYSSTGIGSGPFFAFSNTPGGLDPDPPFWNGNLDNVSVKEKFSGALTQSIASVANLRYRVSVTAGGSTGKVVFSLGGTVFDVPAGTTVTTDVVSGGGLISMTASDDFNGTIDNVSVKAVLSSILLVVFNGLPDATLYYYYANTGAWAASNLTSLEAGFKNRFAVLGNRAFVTNASDGMYSSADGATWAAGTANDCIDAADAKPSLLYRYAARLLAAGDPTYPDRVFFSSIIAPASSPFITWDTDPATGDWIDVNPDDGGNITGFSEASTFLLLFKDNGMYRLDTVNKTVDPENIFNIGAVSQEAITLCQGVTYFFSGIDIRRTNGGYPEQISRLGVQDILDSIPQANWSNIAAGTDGLSVWFSVGDVTLNPNQSNQRIIRNCVLKFSPRDETWSVHSYAQQSTFYTGFVDENGLLLRGADTDGNVQTIDLGVRDATGLVVETVDASEPIYYELETQDIDFGNRAHFKAISDQIAVFTRFSVGAQMDARIDGGDTTSFPVSFDRPVAIMEDINLGGFFFAFRWYGVANDVAPIFNGFYIETIEDVGFSYG